jgi:hypothetical protein
LDKKFEKNGRVGLMVQIKGVHFLHNEGGLHHVGFGRKQNALNEQANNGLQQQGSLKVLIQTGQIVPK